MKISVLIMHVDYTRLAIHTSSQCLTKCKLEIQVFSCGYICSLVYRHLSVAVWLQNDHNVITATMTCCYNAVTQQAVKPQKLV